MDVSENPDFVEDLLEAEKAQRNEALLFATAPDYGQVPDTDFKTRSSVIKELVSAGANINAVNDKNGNTPLCNAVIREDIALIDLLLSLGAALEIETPPASRHVSPLHLACFSGKVSIAQHLLDKGAKVSHEDHSGANALFYAAEGNALDALEWLVEKGLDLLGKDRFGKTPLARICVQPDAETDTIEKILSLHKAESDIKSDIEVAIAAIEDPARDRKNRYVEAQRYRTAQFLMERLPS